MFENLLPDLKFSLSSPHEPSTLAINPHSKYNQMTLFILVWHTPPPTTQLPKISKVHSSLVYVFFMGKLKSQPPSWLSTHHITAIAVRYFLAFCSLLDNNLTEAFFFKSLLLNNSQCCSLLLLNYVQIPGISYKAPSIPTNQSIPAVPKTRFYLNYSYLEESLFILPVQKSYNSFNKQYKTQHH